MQDTEKILEKIHQIYTAVDEEMLIKAYNCAKEAHANQKRASGEPYFIHPCEVANILIDLGLDAATIAAALLHDVIEDTDLKAEDIQREFGDEVLALVSSVTKLEKIVFKSKEEENAENFRKIFVAMAKDVRVIIIKLADRLHNMRSLNFLSQERQQRMASETLDIYAPLAGRLHKYADPTDVVRLSLSKTNGGVVIRQSNTVKRDRSPSESYKMGLYSIRRIAQNYGGTTEVTEADGRFEIVITLSAI